MYVRDDFVISFSHSQQRIQSLNLNEETLHHRTTNQGKYGKIGDKHLHLKRIDVWKTNSTKQDRSFLFIFLVSHLY